MRKYPKTDKGWAGFVARMFKTIKPYNSGGRGLSGNRRFEAAFEGGYPHAPANADNVVRHLASMVQSDLNLARLVVAHDVLDGSGIVGLADTARAAISRATGEEVPDA